jgi:hypothetical protein
MSDIVDFRRPGRCAICGRRPHDNLSAKPVIAGLCCAQCRKETVEPRVVEQMDAAGLFKGMDARDERMWASAAAAGGPTEVEGDPINDRIALISQLGEAFENIERAARNIAKAGDPKETLVSRVSYLSGLMERLGATAHADGDAAAREFLAEHDRQRGPLGVAFDLLAETSGLIAQLKIELERQHFDAKD